MREKEIMRRLLILACRRLIRPSMQDSAEMNALFIELYELTNDEEFNLFPKKVVKNER